MANFNLNRWLREQRKRIFIGLCVVLMVTWIVGSALTRMFTASPYKGGRIFGETVSGKELAGALARVYAASMGRLKRPKARALAWQRLIHLREARRLGLRVGEDEVVARIALMFPARGSTPGGRPHLDVRAYRRALGRLRLTEQQYRKSIEEQLLIEKLQSLVWDSVHVSSYEAWVRYARQNEKVKVRYAAINARDLTDFCHPTEKEIAEFHEKYKRLPPKPPDHVGYQMPERVKVEYILAPYKELEKQVIVTERAVRRYYNENREKYRIKLKPKTETEEKKAEEKKANKKGDSSPAPEPKEQPRYKPVEAVRHTILSELRKEEARRLADDLIEETTDKIAEQLKVEFGSTEIPEADLQKIAAELDLTHTITPYFTKKEAEKVLPGAQGLADGAFGKGMRGLRTPRSPIKARDGKVIFQVIGSQPARPSALDEVRGQVVEDLKLEQALTLAADIGAEARRKGTFDQAVQFIDQRIQSLADPKAPDQAKPEARNANAQLGAKPAPEQSAPETPSEPKPAEPADAKSKPPSASEAAKPAQAEPSDEKPPAQAAEKDDADKPRASTDKPDAKKPKDIRPAWKYVVVGESKFFTPPNEMFGSRAQYTTGLPGNRVDFADAAFNLKGDEIGYALEGKGERACYLLQLIERKPASRRDFEKMKKDDWQMQMLRRAKQIAALEAWQADVRRRADPSAEVLKELSKLPEWAGSAGLVE